VEEVPPGHVTVGLIATAWGVRGVVKVTPLVDKRQRLAPGRNVIVDGERRVIESCRWQRGMVYLKLAGVDDRKAASALRERLVTVPESELEPLPEGHYYRFQLIGLTVLNAAGAELGSIAEILSTGANDIYVVRGEGSEILVPATDDIVKEVDLERGRMVIEEAPGLVPDARKKR
jgi:16S rRNA processing protein RimM